jgi:adenylate cyclase
VANELPQRLAAILAADIANYTRLMELDEVGVVGAWSRSREQVIDPTVARHGGRIVKLTGDGFLAEFSTAQSAVRSALDMQAEFARLFGDVPADRRVTFRMGVNIGDIWVDTEDIYGAGVNIAARLEGLAEPGGLCISGAVYDAVKHRIAARYEPMGPRSVKHVAEPIHVWRVRDRPDERSRVAERAQTARAGRVEGAAVDGTTSRRRWLRRGAALLAVVVVAVAVSRGWNAVRPTEPATQRTQRLAVLPFRNLSGDPAQEYLSDGITDEMISELGRLHPKRLSVIARTSVMRYRDSKQSVAEIGRELGVDYVLEGSVLREGETIRVLPTLIDVRDESRIWGDRYERRLSGMLALQRDMARGIAESLALALLPEEATRLAAAKEVDPEAYDAYLQGRFHWYRETAADINVALEYFNRSLERAPESALVNAWISLVHVARSQLGVARTFEAHEAAKPAADKALALDRDLPEAHLAAAFVHTWQEWDWPDAEREFESAIALNPSYADVRAGYSHYLTIVGRPAEAIEQIERAISVDPFNPLHRSFHAVVLTAVRRCDDAIAIARDVLRVVPTNAVAVQAMNGCLFVLGKHDEELDAWRRQFAALGDKDAVAALERGYAANGYLGAMGAVAALLDSRSQIGRVPPVFAAGFHVRAGHADRALEWLERAFEAQDQNLPYIAAIPIWDSLRDDPRFSSLLRRMNLSAR